MYAVNTLQNDLDNSHNMHKSQYQLRNFAGALVIVLVMPLLKNHISQ